MSYWVGFADGLLWGTIVSSLVVVLAMRRRCRR